MLAFVFLCLFSLALSLPSKKTSSPTWLLANFNALVDTENNTFLTFDFHDIDPANKVDLSCSLAPAFNGTWAVCGKNRELLYKMTSKDVTLKRKMKPNSSNFGMARQDTNWVEGINFTEVNNGYSYWRTEDWLFPIDSVSG